VRYGASLGGIKSSAPNLILGLCLGTFYMQQVTMTRQNSNTQHKHTTNTTTMVVELSTHPAVWI
jgi:hypothetical protein